MDGLWKLKTTMPKMLDLIDWVEWQSHKEHAADLLPDIKDAVYDAEDLLDEFDYYALKLKIESRKSSRTIARHRSRIRFLGEGDANTKIFHLQACHRGRKNYIPSVHHEGQWFSDEEAKADFIFDYYNNILGKPFRIEHALRLDELLPRLDMSGLDICFTADEIWATIKELPSDRAPGPDGFTGLFYKVTWETIKHDVVNAFNALWSLDSRSLNLLNDALMILVRKTNVPTRLKDYRPISLMHSFSKLFTKCLARRLAPSLKEMVAMNQSAFIKDRSIHDNFRAVQLACRWLKLNCKKFPSVLLKVDIARLLTPSRGLFSWKCCSTSGSRDAGPTGFRFSCPRQAQRYSLMEGWEDE
jgi:hypothetical protein